MAGVRWLSPEAMLEPRDISMKASSHLGKSRIISFPLAGLPLLFCLPASAFVLNNFRNKTGGADALNGVSAYVGKEEMHRTAPANSKKGKG